MNSYDNIPGNPSEDSRSPENPAEQQPMQPHAAETSGNPYSGWQNQAPRKESPYANSPYANSPYMNQNYQPPHQDTWGNPTYAPKPPKEKKPKSDHPWGKRVLSGVLAVALVAAGSGITALCLNNSWNNTMADMRQDYDKQIGVLEKKIQSAAQGGIIASPAGPDGALTPSQVYAKNVSSVVAISSNMGMNRMGQTAMATGSGFILSPDGYIATNCHVIDGAVSISVITGDNTEYEAKLLGKDPTNDVAVLKVEAQGLPAVKIGSSNDLLIGDMVVAIGNPLGELTATQTVGYIGGKDRTVTTGEAAIYMLQTDAAINSGNSGGPLFNMKGEVIGITTAKYSGTSGGGASIEGIGFAIPIDDVLGIMKDLVEHGYVTGPYLGVSVKDVDPQIAAAYNIPLGAYIVEVVEGASADRAGIEEKDIIVKLGDQEIKNSNDLIRALRHLKAGESVTMVYNRSGAEHTATIELDEKPQQIAAPEEKPQEEAAPSQGDYEDFEEYMDRFFHDFFGVPRP